MNPDPIAAGSENPANVPPTAGMTTKVVKGSLWTFAGQMLPLGVSLITSPIVIRLLGAEGYGVLILVVLIPTYVSFADFGMGMASTKFGSEAYASGSQEKEARVVRTAALIALLTSLPVATVIFFLSGTLIGWFNVPERLFEEASLSLKLAAVALVLNVLCLIFNTPQLTRLRMDLNTLVNAGFRILGAIAIPIVIYLGGGIAGAMLVLIVVSTLTLLGHIFVSGRLLRELFQMSIERAAIRPMLKFGGALVVGGVAAILLTNSEKLVLTKMTSVENLAFYSAATTLAGMIAMFSGSMIQSLLPAFAQLQSAENRTALTALYSRGVRINLIWLVPGLLALALIAKPFFTVWGGEAFGRESPMPFYILLFGLAFNVLAYLPLTAIMASGRSDILAKVYWIELAPYILLVAWLTSRFGASGAAAAWSVRVVADSAILFWLAKKVGGVSFTRRARQSFISAFGLLLVPLAAILYYRELNFAVIITTLVITAVYALIVWKVVLETEEITWLTNKLNARFTR